MMGNSLTAAAAGLAPLKAPRKWFDDPKLSGPTALTVAADGRVYGHAALWDSCHAGFAGRCVTPPRSQSGYSHFHLGSIETRDGEIPVGKITLASGHASTAAGVSEAQARAHYDDTATVAAYVRAGEDKFGIWLAGAVRPDLPAERLLELKGNPISGDWRGGEMIAAHCVPTPGFAVPRLAASVGPTALVASTAPPVVFAKPDPAHAKRVQESLRRYRPGLGFGRTKPKPKTKTSALQPAGEFLAMLQADKARAAMPTGALIANPELFPAALPADGKLRAVYREHDRLEEQTPNETPTPIRHKR